MYYTEMQNDNNVFFDRWSPEYLLIRTENGYITRVQWNNPTNIVKIDNDNVKIISWDEAKEIFLKQIEIMLSPDVEGDNTEWFFENTEKIHISRIELGLAQVVMAGNNNTYKLIPSWNFMGYETIKDSENDNIKHGSEICFVSVNAIDGSIIDRQNMY